MLPAPAGAGRVRTRLRVRPREGRPGAARTQEPAVRRPGHRQRPRDQHDAGHRFREEPARRGGGATAEREPRWANLHGPGRRVRRFHQDRCQHRQHAGGRRAASGEPHGRGYPRRISRHRRHPRPGHSAGLRPRHRHAEPRADAVSRAPVRSRGSALDRAGDADRGNIHLDGLDGDAVRDRRHRRNRRGGHGRFQHDDHATAGAATWPERSGPGERSGPETPCRRRR